MSERPKSVEDYLRKVAAAHEVNLDDGIEQYVPKKLGEWMTERTVPYKKRSVPVKPA